MRHIDPIDRFCAALPMPVAVALCAAVVVEFGVIFAHWLCD